MGVANWFLVLSILGTLSLDHPLAVDVEGCLSHLDLLFILDSSVSVMDSDPLGQDGYTWLAIKNFTRGIVQHLPVGKETKVAAIRFGTVAEVAFHFAQYHDLVSVEDALIGMDHLGGNTNTAAALRLARTQVFNGDYGARADAKNVVVFIGDGISNMETEYTSQEIRFVKQYSHAEVYAVGISEQILRSELERMVSEPMDMHILHAKTLNDLDRVGHYLVRRICGLPDPDLSTTVKPECPMDGCRECDAKFCFECVDGKFLSHNVCYDCLTKCKVCKNTYTCDQCMSGWFWDPVLNKCEACELIADLALVVDNSGSIRDKNPEDKSYDNYQLLKDFLNRLLDRVDVGLNATRVAAVKFSSKSQLVFHLDEYAHRSMIQKAIMAMSFGGGHTNISGGLRMMRQELFQRQWGDRPDVGNIAIIITDGESTRDKNFTIAEANRAKAEGITLFVVGVTDEVNEQELKSIASSPFKDHYFNSTDIRLLDELLDGLIRQVCAPISLFQT